MVINFRKEWFNWVAKERKRMQRKTKASVSHKAAMGKASISWPKEKAKLKRKADREAKKSQKADPSSKAVPTKADEATSIGL